MVRACHFQLRSSLATNDAGQPRGSIAAAIVPRLPRRGVVGARLPLSRPPAAVARRSPRRRQVRDAAGVPGSRAVRGARHEPPAGGGAGHGPSADGNARHGPPAAGGAEHRHAPGVRRAAGRGRAVARDAVAVARPRPAGPGDTDAAHAGDPERAAQPRRHATAAAGGRSSQAPARGRASAASRPVTYALDAPLVFFSFVIQLFLLSAK
jgi:hypothetical protein